MFAFDSMATYCLQTSLLIKDVFTNFIKVKQDGEERTILIMTWKGKNPKLKSVILHSHTDVVPAYEVKHILYSVCCIF